MNVLEIPDELWVEIFRWVNPPKNEEWSFLMIDLPMVCKRFHQVLKNSEQGNFFYKFVYEQMFKWREFLGMEECGAGTDQSFWFNLLKREINFYRNCNAMGDQDAYRIVRDRTSSKNNVILFKKFVGSSYAAINRQLFFGTGSYYFECVFMDALESSDNVLFGVSLSDFIGGTSYIGSDKNSIGYYFDNGSVYYGGKTVMTSYGQKLATNQTIGLLIDTNNLTLQYIVDTGAFEKIQLSQVAPNIDQSLRNGKAVLPCVSILYDNRRMKLKCFEICSYEKCKWLQDLR